MNILIGTVLLVVLAGYIWTRLDSPAVRHEALRESWGLLKFMLTRIVVALLGAGFIAELLPGDRIEALFGEASGLGGLALACALGPVTPGGAFVSFAIGAAALKAGAAPAQVLAYVTSWSLFSLTRLMAYELPLVGARASWLRVAVSLPVPLIAGITAMALL